jgi:nitrite reductase (NADH) large subunit
MGFTFHLGVTPRKISRFNGRLAVELEDGRILEPGMVLLSAGAAPDLALARKIGLAIGKAVQVDDRLRTSIEDIYAAGDLIEHRGVYYGIWPPAMAQGRAAGANMAGKETLYEGTLPSHRLKVAGIELVTMGDIDAEGEDDCVVRTDEEKCVYRKLVIENHAVAGAILLGDLHGEKAIQAAVEGHKDLSAVRETMAEEGFDLSEVE